MSGEVKATVVSVEKTDADNYYWGMARSESQFMEVRFSVRTYRRPIYNKQLGFHFPMDASVGPPRKPVVGDKIYFFPLNRHTAQHWCFALEWEDLRNKKRRRK